jgi:glutamate/tyrosine decarboxylase-like PLP-dependent enzyme
MSEDRRRITLDLPANELDALLLGAQELAKRELSAAHDGPVFETPPTAADVRQLLTSELELPLEGEQVKPLLERCARIMAAGRRTAPTFFGYVLSPAAPVGVAADLVASAANQNVTAWRSSPAATELELLTIRWLGQFVGFSDDATGVLLSGGSAANLTALVRALRERSTPETDRRSLVVYASQEAHFSVAKAAEVVGVRLRTIAVDEHWRMDVDALGRTIEEDRSAGLEPFCVVATAGTTSTGAVDPVDEIVGAAAGLWVHVDGAYGLPAAAVPSHRELFSGVEAADSVAIDAHKWLYAPLDCGVLLFKTFHPLTGHPASDGAAYLRVLADDERERFAFWDHGLELSRRFRALKLWMIFRFHGARKIAAAIANDIEMAAYMADQVRRSGDMQLLAEPSLSICCFRHRPPTLAEEHLDAHNERLLALLQRDGAVYLSNAKLRGSFALRACITNFRTTRSDVDRAIDRVRNIGGQLLESSGRTDSPMT